VLLVRVSAAVRIELQVTLKSTFDHAASAIDVFAHLGGDFLDARKLLLASQKLDELNAQLLSVQIAVEADDVNFK